MIRSRYSRRGVTLVEMLVATAMCILGMWMLTWMFQQATASFSLANSQATLTAQERMVTTIMSRDLEADRYSPDDRFLPTSRGTRVSNYDPRFPGPMQTPVAGYLYARSLPTDLTDANLRLLGITSTGDASGTPLRNDFEASDGNGFGSSRSGNHFMQFTVVRADEPGNRVSVAVPAGGAGTTAGTALEVSYFLVPNGTSSTGARTYQLYDLVRVQRLVAHNSYDKADYEKLVLQPAYNPPATTPPTPPDAAEEVMAAVPPVGMNPFKMFTLSDLAGGNGRFGRTVRTTASKRYGEDRLLSNVLSMEVKYTGPREQRLDRPAGAPPTLVEPWPTTGVYGTTQNSGSPPIWPRPFDPYLDPTTNIGYPYRNTDYPYDFLPHDGLFDTGDPYGPRQPVAGQNNVFRDTRTPLRITGVQIRLRVLFGTTARQTTIVVAL